MAETKLKKPEVEPFVEKILTEAKKSANEIVEAAKKAAEEAIKMKEEEAKEKARQDIKKQMDSTKIEAERTKARIISEAKVKLSWVTPSVKDKLIQKTFNDIEAKMESFTGKPEYKAYIEKLIMDSAKTLGGGEIVVITNERDSKLKLDLKKISENLTRELGTSTSITLSPKPIQCIGGVMINTADGKIAIDNTVERIIERASREYRLKVARELFAS